jgi:hypothetical protein
MPAKIALMPHAADQQQILFYDRRVGYCGYTPNMPVCFLTDKRNQCGLTKDERIEVLQYVRDNVGPIKWTPQTGELLKHVQEPESVDDSRHSGDRGSSDENGGVS